MSYFILEANHTLLQKLCDQGYCFCLIFHVIVDIHKYTKEWCLTIGVCHGINLIVESLNSVRYFFVCILTSKCFSIKFVHSTLQVLIFVILIAISYKWRKMGKIDRTTTIRRTGNSSNNLRSDSSRCQQTMRFINFYTVNYCAVLKHIFQVYEFTVMERLLSEVVHIMKMQDAFIMCFYNFWWKQKTPCNISACNTSNVISLSGYNTRVLVAILRIPVIVFTVNQFFNGLISGIAFAHKMMQITIFNVSPCHILVSTKHKFLGDNILNFFNRHIDFFTVDFSSNLISKTRHFICYSRVYFYKCLANRLYNLVFVKFNLSTISLSDSH